MIPETFSAPGNRHQRREPSEPAKRTPSPPPGGGVTAGAVSYVRRDETSTRLATTAGRRNASPRLPLRSEEPDGGTRRSIATFAMLAQGPSGGPLTVEELA